MTTYTIDVYYKLNRNTNLDDMEYLLNTHVTKYGGVYIGSDVEPYTYCCCFQVIRRITRFIIPVENINEFKSQMPKKFHIDKCFLLQDTSERSSYIP